MKRKLARLTVLAAVLAIGTIASAAPSVSPAKSTSAHGALDARSMSNSPHLVERLERLGDFSILLTALRTANLEEALATGGPFTLFAPTDRAFADLLDQLHINAPELLATPTSQTTSSTPSLRDACDLRAAEDEHTADASRRQVGSGCARV